MGGRGGVEREGHNKSDSDVSRPIGVGGNNPSPPVNQRLGAGDSHCVRGIGEEARE